MEKKDSAKYNSERLSDRILYAMDLALDQEDIAIADMLSNVLEASVTRNAGGQNFVERRKYPEGFQEAFLRLQKLKDQ